METGINFFSEDVADYVVSDDQYSDAYPSFFNEANPKGDDDDEEEDNEEEDDDTTNSDDDPPLDENVVHSPVVTQPGGKPKQS